ncbi:MAG: DUF4296 domain-containing protein [Flavobacteriaceae bacterium]
MKNLLKYLILSVIFWGCQDKPQPPENLIPEGKMVDIMYEMAIIQAVKSYDYQLLNQKKIEPTRYIYEKFGVDSLQFVQSNKYYASQLERYEKMHDLVIDRLSENKKKADSLTPQLKELKEPAKPSDSLVKFPKSFLNKK